MLKRIKYLDEQTKKVLIMEVNSNEEWAVANGFSKELYDVVVSDIDNEYYIAEYCPMKTDEQKAKEEAERIALLHLTKREVFLGLHKAKQVTPDMIKAKITDPEALIEFEYATEYYRGNPLIDMVGEALGITPKQLDKFFDTNNYLYLTDCTFTINATPLEATVVMNDTETKTVTVPFGTVIKYMVSCEGYKPNNGSIEAVTNLDLDIVLEKEELPNENTTNTEPVVPDEETIKADNK